MNATPSGGIRASAIPALSSMGDTEAALNRQLARKVAMKEGLYGMLEQPRASQAVRDEFMAKVVDC